MMTILDVLDNFLSLEKETDFLKISGNNLYNLGEEVRRFSDSYTLPKCSNELHPIYLGGWPSANFWNAYENKYIFSSLLYSGQILVKDPISDWFSDEQYQLPAFLSSRKGYIDPDNGYPNIQGTRIFLSIIVPELLKLRSLIEKGIIVLIPSKKYIYSKREIIQELTEKITGKIISNKEFILKNFRPSQLATDDNKRGGFLLIGNNQNEQIETIIRDSIKYFVSEYVLSSNNGYYYTSSFPFESFLCENGLEKTLISGLPGSKVLKAILNSNFPLYSGLTPEIISEIKDDDNICSFRQELYEIYNNIPDNINQEDLTLYLKEIEELKIKPKLVEIRNQVDRGILSKIGISLFQSTLRIAGTVLAAKMLTPVTSIEGLTIAAIIEEVFSKISNYSKPKQQSSLIIWKKIYNHNQKYSDMFKNYKYIHSKTNNSTDYWVFPESGLEVNITEASIIFDYINGFPPLGTPKVFPPIDYYSVCPCGSGKKFKFCCKGLEKHKWNFN